MTTGAPTVPSKRSSATRPAASRSSGTSALSSSRPAEASLREDPAHLEILPGGGGSFASKARSAAYPIRPRRTARPRAGRSAHADVLRRMRPGLIGRGGPNRLVRPGPRGPSPRGRSPRCLAARPGAFQLDREALSRPPGRGASESGVDQPRAVPSPGLRCEVCLEGQVDRTVAGEGDLTARHRRGALHEDARSGDPTRTSIPAVVPSHRRSGHLRRSRKWHREIDLAGARRSVEVAVPVTGPESAARSSLARSPPGRNGARRNSRASIAARGAPPPRRSTDARPAAPEDQPLDALACLASEFDARGLHQLEVAVLPAGRVEADPERPAIEGQGHVPRPRRAVRRIDPRSGEAQRLQERSMSTSRSSSPGVSTSAARRATVPAVRRRRPRRGRSRRRARARGPRRDRRADRGADHVPDPRNDDVRSAQVDRPDGDSLRVGGEPGRAYRVTRPQARIGVAGDCGESLVDLAEVWQLEAHVPAHLRPARFADLEPDPAELQLTLPDDDAPVVELVPLGVQRPRRRWSWPRSRSAPSGASRTKRGASVLESQPPDKVRDHSRADLALEPSGTAVEPRPVSSNSSISIVSSSPSSRTAPLVTSRWGSCGQTGRRSPPRTGATARSS